MDRTTLSPAQFAGVLAGALGRPDAVLAPGRPLAEQLHVDSVRLVELSVVLEEDLGMDLADDCDLRAATPDSLYGVYRAGH